MVFHLLASQYIPLSMQSWLSKANKKKKKSSYRRHQSSPKWGSCFFVRFFEHAQNKVMHLVLQIIFQMVCVHEKKPVDKGTSMQLCYFMSDNYIHTNVIAYFPTHVNAERRNANCVWRTGWKKYWFRYQSSAFSSELVLVQHRTFHENPLSTAKFWP